MISAHSMMQAILTLEVSNKFVYHPALVKNNSLTSAHINGDSSGIRGKWQLLKSRRILLQQQDMHLGLSSTPSSTSKQEKKFQRLPKVQKSLCRWVESVPSRF